jgi:hypothetical protein
MVEKLDVHKNFFMSTFKNYIQNQLQVFNHYLLIVSPEIIWKVDPVLFDLVNLN